MTKWIRQLPSGAQALNQGRARIYSPYFLSSVGHISISRANEYMALQLVHEGRGWLKQVKVGNIQIRPWISVQKTAYERRRNRKVNASSRALLKKPPSDSTDKAREPWKTVC